MNIGPVRLAAEVQARSGGFMPPSTGNAFEGNIGFDYMGFSMDFVGGKIYDSVGIGGSALSQAALTTCVNNFGAIQGCVPATVSDNTLFSVGARYTIGPWKLFGGYENIHFANPNNPLNAGAVVQGTYIAPTPNNTNFINNKILQTAWVGVRYAITLALDITGACTMGGRTASAARLTQTSTASSLPDVPTLARPSAPVRWMPSRWLLTGVSPSMSTSSLA